MEISPVSSDFILSLIAVNISVTVDFAALSPEDILDLMKDEVNIISTGIINLIYENIKKIMAYSNEVFEDLCEQLNEVYNNNVQKFNQDTKNFDEEKNIIINKILIRT